MAQREEVYAERNRRVQEVCQDHSELYQHPSKGKTFWFDLNDHLAICMHAKVRSSNQTDLALNAFKVAPAINICLGWLLNMEKKHAYSF